MGSQRVRHSDPLPEVVGQLKDPERPIRFRGIFDGPNPSPVLTYGPDHPRTGVRVRDTILDQVLLRAGRPESSTKSIPVY